MQQYIENFEDALPSQAAYRRNNIVKGSNYDDRHSEMVQP